MKKSEFDIKRNLLVIQLNNLDKQYIEENCPLKFGDVFQYMEITYQVAKIYVVRVIDENGHYVNEIAIAANRYRMGKSLNDRRVFREKDIKDIKKL